MSAFHTAKFILFRELYNFSSLICYNLLINLPSFHYTKKAPETKSQTLYIYSNKYYSPVSIR